MDLPDELTPRAFEEAIDKHIARWTGDQVSPPGLLYHYTDPTGFLGIVGERTIYATDARFLNDRAESTHAFDLLSKGETDAAMLLAIAKLRKGNAVTLHGCYLTCLSEDCDSLSQWRAYGADALGFAIGLETDAVHQASATAIPTVDVRYPLLLRVVYDDAAKAGSLQDVKDLLRYSLVREPTYSDLAFRGAQTLMTFYAITFKHAAFAEEREWRLVWPRFLMTNAPVWQPAFRATQRRGLAPYLAWPLQSDPNDARSSPIRKVYCGPRTPDGTAESCEAFLANKCCATVERSDAPYC